MSKFTKKISGVFNKATDAVLDSEAVPAVRRGGIVGALTSASGVAAGFMLVGASTVLTPIGLPIMVAGAIIGGVSGGLLHKKKRGTKGSPKPTQLTFLAGK